MSIYRWLEPLLTSSLQNRRVIIIAGPRQCGKTTLTKQLFANNAHYVTLDDTSLLAAAQSDPSSFIKSDNQLMIIDEVQRAPELLPAIKLVVDNNTSPGQYLLTGSANIQSLPNVTESLAGRIRKLRLRTFSQGEINQRPPSFLTDAFNQEFSPPTQTLNKDQMLAVATRGGFPEPLHFSPRERNEWHRDYIEALLDHDLREIVNIRRRDSMQQLLITLAAWSSKYINIEAIGANLSLKRETIESYINALEALFLIEKLPAWAKTDYARVGRQAKLFISDSGLMASILKWQHQRIRLDPEKVGKLTETFIYHELACHTAYQPGYEMYHYRDREKREIDFLIERDDGALLGIEVKAGTNIKSESFKHLKWFAANLVKQQSFIGIILYTGSEILSFGDNLWAIPIACL